MIALKRLVKQTDGFLQAEGGAAGGFVPAIKRYPMEVKDAAGNKCIIQRSARQTGFIDFFRGWGLGINIGKCIADYEANFQQDLSDFELNDEEIWTEYMCTKLERKLDGADDDLEGNEYTLNFNVSEIPAELLTREWAGGAQSHPSRGIRTATDGHGNQYIVNFNSRKVLKALSKQPPAAAYETTETLKHQFIECDKAKAFIVEFISIIYPRGTITWSECFTVEYMEFRVSTVHDSYFVMEFSPEDVHIHFKIFKG